MSNLTIQMNGLLQRIRDAEPETRYRLQPQLERLIDQMDAKGEIVTAQTRLLSDELLSEVVEAQFDNLPV